MSTPDRGDYLPFKTYSIGWRIPPEILEPLLHRAAPAAAAEGLGNESDNAAESPAAE
jgi:hypothetical protein